MTRGALRKHLTDDQPRGEINDEQIRFDCTTLATLVSRIEVQRNHLLISMKSTDGSGESEALSISWHKPPSKRSRKMLLPHGTLRENVRPERVERRARLVSAIARGRRWLNEIVTGSITDADQLAKRERCTVRQVNMTLSLAFLAPQLVKLSKDAYPAASISSACAILILNGAGSSKSLASIRTRSLAFDL
jgi:hypothetical protein